MRLEKELVVRDLLVSYIETDGAMSDVPLVFLHGWRSSKDAWNRALDACSEYGRHAYALDLPGFGRSESPNGAYDVHLYADLVKEFLSKLGVSRAIIVGHSFGGRIAIVLAAKHASVVHKLVLVDSAGVRQKSASLSIMNVFARIMKPFFAPSFMHPLRRAVYRFIGADDYLETPHLKETFIKTIEEDLTPLLPSISSETLIIWGENDTDTPLAHAALMKEQIPNASLVVLKAAGHFSFMDAPDAFAKELLKFISI